MIFRNRSVGIEAIVVDATLAIVGIAFANSHAARLDATGAGSIAARYWRMSWQKAEHLLLMTRRVENSEVFDESFARFFAGDYSANKSR